MNENNYLVTDFNLAVIGTEYSVFVDDHLAKLGYFKFLSYI